MKVTTVFVVICLLWSFWTSASIEEWLAVMSVAAEGSVLEWLSFVALWALAIAIGVAIQLYGNRTLRTKAKQPVSLPLRAAWVGGAAIFLLAIANPEVSSRLDSRSSDLVATITGDTLNTRDQQQLVKGYYEQMLGAEASGAMAWGVLQETPDDWQWNGEPESDFVVAIDDIRLNVYRPNLQVVTKGGDFSTNQWGMRGPEIEKAKPSGTKRIAFLGSSYTVGAGVDVDLTFPSLLQDQLNDKDGSPASGNFEILNFAYPGESILRSSTRLQKQALDFDIDFVVYMSVTDEIQFALRNLREVIQRSASEIDPFLLDVARRAKVTGEMSADEIERRLRPFGTELIEWGYQELARFSTQNNIPAVVIVLPRTGDTDSQYEREWEFLSQVVRESGLVAIDLEGVYGPMRDRSNLKLAPWDWHPNIKGHELLGRRIYKELMDTDLLHLATVSVDGNVSQKNDE